jgi:hypothetical protein
MPWSPALASRYIDILAADAAADSGEVARLKRATPEDVSHPALMRAFVRGACGFDLALDEEEMTLFYAVCLGDADVFGELVERLDAMDRDWLGGESVAQWIETMEAFWARPDVVELKRIAEARL